jgi:hypothetical protein
LRREGSERRKLSRAHVNHGAAEYVAERKVEDGVAERREVPAQPLKDLLPLATA